MKLCLAIVLGLFALALTENPGLRVRLTKKLADGVTSKLGGLVGKAMDKLPELVEKFKGKSKDKNMTIHSIELTKKDLPAGEFTMMEPNKVKFTLKGGDLSLTADVTAAAFQNKRGKIVGSLGDMDISLTLPLDTTEDGKLQFGEVECSLKLGKLDLDASDFADEMITKQAAMMAQMGKTMAEGMACPYLTQGLAMANAKLSAHDMTWKIEKKDVEDEQYLPGRKLPEGYEFRYNLVNPIKVTPEFAQFDIKGLFIKTVRDRSAINYNPEDMVDGEESTHQIHFLMVDELVNQFFRELHHHNEIYFTLPEKASKGLLNKMIEHKEETGKDVEEGDDLEVKISAVEAPKIKHNEEGMTMECTMKVDFKHTRGAEVLGEPSVTVKDKSQWTATVLEQGDRILPNVKEEMKFTEFDIIKFENFKEELDEEKKAKITKMMREMVQKYVNQFINEEDKYATFMQGPGKDIDYLKMENLWIKSALSTLQVAFDFNIDVDKLWEFVEKESAKEGAM